MLSEAGRKKLADYNAARGALELVRKLLSKQEKLTPVKFRPDARLLRYNVLLDIWPAPKSEEEAKFLFKMAHNRNCYVFLTTTLAQKAQLEAPLAPEHLKELVGLLLKSVFDQVPPELDLLKESIPDAISVELRQESKALRISRQTKFGELAREAGQEKFRAFLAVFCRELNGVLDESEKALPSEEIIRANPQMEKDLHAVISCGVFLTHVVSELLESQKMEGMLIEAAKQVD